MENQLKEGIGFFKWIIDLVPAAKAAFAVLLLSNIVTGLLAFNFKQEVNTERSRYDVLADKYTALQQSHMHYADSMDARWRDRFETYRDSVFSFQKNLIMKDAFKNNSEIERINRNYERKIESLENKINQLQKIIEK